MGRRSENAVLRVVQQLASHGARLNRDDALPLVERDLGVVAGNDFGADVPGLRRNVHIAKRAEIRNVRDVLGQRQVGAGSLIESDFICCNPERFRPNADPSFSAAKNRAGQKVHWRLV